MEFDKFKDKKIKELINDKKEKLADLFFEIKSGNLTDLKEYRKLKKEVARLSTILQERKLGIRKIKIVKEKKVSKKKKQEEATKKAKKEKSSKITKTKNKK